MWYINGRVESLPLTNMRYINGWVESIGIIKLHEGLPKFMRGFRDGLAKNFVDFMRVSREGLV